MTDQSVNTTTGADPEKHRRLIQTAAQEFASIGFERAAVDRIAENAGVAKGTVYLYFDSKAALFRAVLGELHQRLAEIWLARTPSADPADDLAALIRSELELADESPDLFRCYTSALFGVNRDFQQDALAILAWQQSLLRPLLATADAQADVNLKGALLGAAVLAAGLVRGVNGAEERRDTTLEETVLLKGFLASQS
jgi:AcrR family transcriptional regulator